MGGGDIHTTALPTRLEHKSPVRERKNYTQLPCLTRTQVNDERGMKGWHTHNCPAYNNQAQVADQEGGDIYTTALLTKLERKSPIREGENYTQSPCLQHFNTSHRSEAGGDYTQLPCLQDSNTSGRSGRGEGVTYTQTLCLQVSKTSRRSGAGENYTQPPCLQVSNTSRRSGAEENYTKPPCLQDSNTSR